MLALALAIAVGAHAATGELTFAQCLDDEDTNPEGAKCANAPALDGAFSVAVSGDGKSLYAASQDDDAIVRFDRNTNTGALTFAQCFDDEDEPGEGAKCTEVPGLGGPRSVAVSGDGKSLYAASASDGAIVRFDRNTTTGALTFADCFDDEDTDPETMCTNTPGLDGATSVAVSADGKSLYSASTGDDAIVRFNRNTATGALTFAQCVEDEDTDLEGVACTNAPGLGGAFSVTVSGDGKSLYSAAFTDGIVRFNRNTTTGEISFATCFDDEDTDPEGPTCTNTPGLGGARSVAVSGDGNSLYAASNSDDTIVRFNRNTTTGGIGFSECFDDEDTGTEGAKCTNASGLDGAVSVALSGDGESLYAASQDDDAIVHFNRTTTGAISFAACFDDEDTNLEGAKCANAPGLDGTRSVRMSGDGKSLYAASNTDDAIVRFNRELPPPVDTPPSNEFSFEKVKKNKKRGTATLTVRIEQGPGELELAKTKKVKPAEKQPQAAGDVKLKVKPKGKSKKRLERVRKGKPKATARVRADVTYTPTGGEPNMKSKKVKLVKR